MYLMEWRNDLQIDLMKKYEERNDLQIYVFNGRKEGMIYR